MTEYQDEADPAGRIAHAIDTRHNRHPKDTVPRVGDTVTIKTNSFNEPFSQGSKGEIVAVTGKEDKGGWDYRTWYTIRCGTRHMPMARKEFSI